MEHNYWQAQMVQHQLQVLLLSTLAVIHFQLIFFASDTYLKAGTLATAIGNTNLTSATDATVLAFDTTAVSANVRSSLGRLGNLQQTVSSRQDYLTAAVTNNTATISNIFDADVVAQQITSSKIRLLLRLQLRCCLR